MIKFATDFDDCMFETSKLFLELIGKRVGKNYIFPTKCDYNLANIFPDVDIKVLVEIVGDVLLNTNNIEPVYGLRECLPAIQYIIQNPIHIITYRKDSTRQVVKENIQNAGINITSIISMEKDEDYNFCITPAKSKTINRYEIEVFVEDRPDVIEEVLENTNCFVIIMNRPWNTKSYPLSRTARVWNWYGVYNMICKLLLDKFN